MKKAVFIFVCTLLLVILLGQIKIEPTREQKAPVEKTTDRAEPGIKSMWCKSLYITIRQAIPVRLTGSVQFEGQKLRLRANSLFGPEIDVGMNEKSLWYWSRRLRPRALYYCSMSEISKSGLKSALNPSWIMTSLCLDESKPPKSERIVVKQGEMYLYKHEGHSESGMTIAKLFDRDSLKGVYLFAASGKMVASSEVSFKQVVSGRSIPRSLHVIWYDEGIVMDWTLGEVSLGSEMPSESWTMPSISPSIDISR